MTRKKILVVEDNEDNRRILVYRLRKIGDFEILEAQNGLEAIEMTEKHAPDLIFMDLKMPVMDGWEATKRIRVTEGGRRVAIIALTSVSRSSSRSPRSRSTLSALSTDSIGYWGTRPAATGCSAAAAVSTAGTLTRWVSGRGKRRTAWAACSCSRCR